MIADGSYLSRRSNWLVRRFHRGRRYICRSSCPLGRFSLAFNFGLERGAGPGLIFRMPPIALLNCREVIGLLRGFSFSSALPPSPHRFRSWR